MNQPFDRSMDIDKFVDAIRVSYAEGRIESRENEVTFWLSRLSNAERRRVLERAVSIQQDVLATGSGYCRDRYARGIFFLLLFFDAPEAALDAARYLNSTLDKRLLDSRLPMKDPSLLAPSLCTWGNGFFFRSAEEDAARIRVSLALFETLPDGWLELLCAFIEEDLHRYIGWITCDDTAFIPEGFYPRFHAFMSMHMTDAVLNLENDYPRSPLPLRLVCVLSYNDAVARKLIQTKSLTKLLECDHFSDPCGNVHEQLRLLVPIARLEMVEFDSQLQHTLLSCVMSLARSQHNPKQAIDPGLQFACFLNSNIREMIVKQGLTGLFPLVFPKPRLFPKSLQRVKGVVDALVMDPSERLQRLMRKAMAAAVTATSAKDGDLSASWKTILRFLRDRFRLGLTAHIWIPDSGLKKLCQITLPDDGSTILHVLLLCNAPPLWFGATLRLAPHLLNAKNRQGRIPIQVTEPWHLHSMLRQLVLDPRLDIRSLLIEDRAALNSLQGWTGWHRRCDLLFERLAARGIYQKLEHLTPVFRAAGLASYAPFQIEAARLVWSLPLNMPQTPEDMMRIFNHLEGHIAARVMVEVLLRASFILSFVASRWVYQRRSSKACPFFAMVPSDVIRRLFSEFTTIFSVRAVMDIVQGTSQPMLLEWRWTRF